MKKSTGTEHPAPPSYESASDSTSNICCISLNQYDKIRLIGTPPHFKHSFSEMLNRCWSRGVQDQRDYYGQLEFKLRGNPWLGQGDQAVSSRTLLIGILCYMEQQGWRYLTAIDVSKKSADKDSLFFEFTGITCNPVIFSISLNRSDLVRVIDAPPDIPDVVRNVIRNNWRIQDESRYCSSWEFKLQGNPWFANGEETVLARILLMKLISTLRSVGYKLYATVDISASSEGRDLDSWFFRKVDS